MAAAQPSSEAQLDELMMAMDVVDTLRHEGRLAAKELAQEERDEDLKKRLRDIYEGQGLEVTEAILDEGIKALRESRFTYRAPEPGWRVTLAKLWIKRGTVGLVLLGVVAALLVLVGVALWQAGSEDRRLASLSEDLTTYQAQLLPLSESQEARARAVQLLEQATAALEAPDLDRLESLLGNMAALRQTLAQAYSLQIVSRPGERTGVFRVPDANSSARNYYLIVEAVDPSGNTLSVPITSEETGETKSVSIWGLRVPRAVYNQVAQDKTDDGILQNNIIGEKAAGTLEPVYSLPVSGGAILDW